MNHLSELATGKFGEVPAQKKPEVSFCVPRQKLMQLKAKAASKPKSDKITMKPILSFTRVKKVNDNKYCIYASANQVTLNKIVSKLLAFNDMEITYSDSLEGNELIKKSKKPLWAISKGENGEFILERQF